MLRRLPSYFVPSSLLVNDVYSPKKKTPKKKNKSRMNQVKTISCYRAIHSPSSCPNCLRNNDWSIKNKKKTKIPGHLEEISKVIKRIMLHFDLPNSVIQHIIQKMNVIVKSRVNDAISKLSKHHEEEKAILKEEYTNRETEFKRKLTEVDKYLNDEAKKIEKEHKKLVILTENMLSNEKNFSEKSKEVENKLKRMSELERKLVEEVTKVESTVVQPKAVVERYCKSKHCEKECEEIKKELEQLKIQKNGSEKIVENQNILIANLTAKSTIMYKQLQEKMYTIEELKGQLEKQKELLEIERRMRYVNSDRTLSSSEVLTVGTDGEGDHNAKDAIKQSHKKLEQLERESEDIERKFQQFRLSRKPY